MALRRSRTTATGVGAIVLTVLVAACSTDSPRAPVQTQGTLQVIGPWEITSLDPLRAGYAFTRMQVTETVLDATDDGRPLPGLAASWDISADGLLWRFRLRPGARFHDGRPVLATDLVRTLERARVEPGALALAPMRRLYVDGSDLVIELTDRFAPLPALLAHSSAQVLSPDSYRADGSVARIIGTGPYRISELAVPQRFDVESVDPEPAPGTVRRASYLSVGRAETRALLSESGQGDLVFGLDPASLDRLRTVPGVTIEGATIPRAIVLLLNAGLPALSDVRARQAISLAIDRRAIARSVLRDPAMAATQLFPPSLAGWHVPDLTPLTTDLERARALLRDLRWTPGSDGVLQRDGVRFALELRSFPDRPELPVLAAVIQEQLRQIGVSASLSIGNSGEIPLGHRDGSLQLGLAARNYAIVPDPTGTLMQDFGPQGGDWGAMHWSEPGVVAALRQLASGAGEGDDSLRVTVSTALQEQLPVIPIAWYRQTVAVNQRVSGVSIDPLERSYRLTALRWSSSQQPAR